VTTDAPLGTVASADEVVAYLMTTHPLSPDGWKVVKGAPQYVLADVPLSRLRIRPPLYSDNRARVDMYRRWIAQDSEPPPIVCSLAEGWKFPITAGTVLDGHHRANALLEEGRDSVRAWVASYESGCVPPGLDPTMLSI
jgi:hypothetical protein